jgi:cytochrome P450
MLLNPKVLNKAQEEIDRVVGRCRQPDFGDMDNLLYVEAICKEVLRWRPVIPLGVPHSNTVADEYEGMYIPAGSKIYTNIE